MATDVRKVWLITGASSGIGAAIARSALNVGHRVIACARDIKKASAEIPEVEAAGGRWVQLDVTDQEAQQVVSKAVLEAGRVDVVVNNAAYCLLGSLENLSDEEITLQMNTNFLGPLRVMKGALPTMRKQRSGTIVQISSQVTFGRTPNCCIYAASKAALEAASESLALDCESFGIRVVIVQLGAFRTGAFVAMHRPAAPLERDYAESVVGKSMKLTAYLSKNPQANPGDPSKAGDRVVDFVEQKASAQGLRTHLRLILGPDALQVARQKLTTFEDNVNAVGEIAMSTNYDKMDNAAKDFLNMILTRQAS